MQRSLLCKEILNVYPYYNVGRFNDRTLACIHTKVLSESKETRVRRYKNYLAKTNNIDMYHEVKSLLLWMEE